MTAISKALPLSAARPPLLDQYLLACPICAKPGAAHVGHDAEGFPMLVRFVCPTSCTVAAEAVLAACLPRTSDESLTA